MKNSETRNPIDLYIKIILISLLLIWSFYIVRPFVTLIVWAIIVAVALYPIYQKLLSVFKGKKKGLVTAIFVIVLLTIVVMPTISMTGSIIQSGKEGYASFEEGSLKIPPPNESVSEWPLIGKKLYSKR